MGQSLGGQRGLMNVYDQPSPQTPAQRGGVGEQPGGAVSDDVEVGEALERQQALGEQLRRMFDEVVEEDLPDDFKAMLAQLGEGEGGDDAEGAR